MYQQVQVRINGQRSTHSNSVIDLYGNTLRLSLWEIRVLIKIKEAEEKTEGGILLPSTAQTKPQGGEVVAVGKNNVEISVKTGA